MLRYLPKASQQVRCRARILMQAQSSATPAHFPTLSQGGQVPEAASLVSWGQGSGFITSTHNFLVRTGHQAPSTHKALRKENHIMAQKGVRGPEYLANSTDDYLSD